ncbi:SDR family NAD(P)-dependent oxidoreductase [Gordonia hydrophobica]|uniref:SDR family NAD(P)-dependent oxidoreductase n=1 Tax=Gordonia hydrophobica TaxID=40516 RepID=A0ABZ2TZT2_9ACTN|nr:SDR family NAD(P)-dependent oxidoreductase [Gordonia hydrophobica]MBM7369222.1 NAD(P)-dependent dehydrogenase (short-subunit alcohol dehydrogenase family) [Gordonia hydrophobica]
MGLLDNRVIIVTGGGMGLGRAHSLELAAQGATVIIVDPGVSLDGSANTDTPARSVVREIAALGGKAEVAELSVTDYDGIADLIRSVVSEHGDLHAVVNNAGITRDKMITSMTERDFDDVLAVHLKGTFNLIRHAAGHWRERSKAGEAVSGRIINTTSGSGMRGNVGQSSYSAAKSAIAALTVVSAMELGRYGVTVNAISPVARTRMTEAAGGILAEADDSAFDPYAPENSSPVVAYLASVRSEWLTGQVLRVDGNMLRTYRRWSLGPNSFSPNEDRALRVDEMDTALRALYGAMPLGLTDHRLTPDE